MNKKAKVMKVGEDSLHDSAAYLRFKQKRSEGTTISGPILCEKAVQLYKKMYGEDAKFSGSKGGSARDMAYVTCRSKVKNCQLIQMPANTSFLPSMATLKRSILLFIRYLIAMKLVLILGYCQTRHRLLILKNQLMGARKVKTGSP